MTRRRSPEALRTDGGPPTPPRQAATVILLRGGAERLEVLLVQRNPEQRFMGGAWVFPGGAVDAHEGEGDVAHRAAGVREMAEEAGVELADPAALVRFSRWITPEAVKIRFDTHFFLAPAPDGAQPQPDGSETVDLRWYSPQDALDAYERDELLLFFPTIKTLERLSAFGSADELLEWAGGREVEPVEPQVVREGETARIVLPGEPGHVTSPKASGDEGARSPGRRNPNPVALTVAVTGPTGDIGRALLRRLDGEPGVERVLGMARRPFDPASLGLSKTEYRQGDVLDREAVAAFAAEADVLVHLAFIILGGREETRSINLEGSRNVFEAARGVPRLVYTSSVAAYGFHAENPQPLTEDVPARGSDAHYYSAQKAELEETLRDALDGADVETYVFRPCIVAGGDALALVEAFPKLLRKSPLPLARPVLPDPGTPFQLVHTEDVAAALAAAVRGEGPPGIYNLAATGTIQASDLARAFGWLTVPMPRAGVAAAAEAVARLPFMPAQASWINAMRVPVVMDTSRARDELGWEPRYDTRAVLADTVASARRAGLLP